MGGVRLISSASTMLAKSGPFTNRNARLPVVWSSSSTAVPVMSDGIRSGVNCTRLNDRCSTSEIVLTSSVLANPGTPTSSTCPWQNMAVSTCSTTSSCPTITLPSSLRMTR